MSVRLRRCAISLALVLLVSALSLAAVALGAGKQARVVHAARAKAGLAPPRVGPWKVIAAEGNSNGGVKVTGGVVGSFRVTADKTITGFHMSFTETGESAGCAGGEGFESKPEGKRGTVKFVAGSTAPILKVAGQWLVAGSAGSTVQPADVALTDPYGNNVAASLYITMATRKKTTRSGGLLWGNCGLAFVVKPG